MKTYIVSRLTQSGGEAYLVPRKLRTQMSSNAYRWAKRAIKEAAPLSYDAARKAAKRYNGVAVEQ